MNRNFTQDSQAAQYQQARRSAGKKLGWYLHAMVYVLVNLGLITLAWSQGRHWALYPALGWGLGLLAHGLAVWLTSPNSPWWKRMVERELEQLQSTEKR
ncbi:2TM domain-containing protein [Comamonas aquatilis]|uniref:2TM domain-containing protein n=1 Tax=Comamonas aquatilis TaxID=1778406 RepID=UPI0039EE87BE